MCYWDLSQPRRRIRTDFVLRIECHYLRSHNHWNRCRVKPRSARPGSLRQLRLPIGADEPSP
jgi:hypothetical protein